MVPLTNLFNDFLDAAKEVGITVAEMMEEASNAGIKSTETIEEYKAGLKLLS